MRGDGPVRAGFRAIGSAPSLVVAEVAWRWAFGAAMIVLVVLGGFVFLDTLPVSATDRLLLASGFPPLIGRAMANIFQGSGAKLLQATAVLAPALILLWSCSAALGRTALLKTLQSPTPKLRKRTLFWLSFARAMSNVATALCVVGAAAIAAKVAGPAKPTPPHPERAAAVFILLSAGIVTGWWMLNIVLSAAPAFAANVSRASQALTGAVEAFKDRPGRWFWIATAFGLLHVVIWGAAMSFGPMVLNVAAVSGKWWLLLIALWLVLLVYFAFVDALHAARFASCVWAAGQSERAQAAAAGKTYS